MQAQVSGCRLPERNLYSAICRCLWQSPLQDGDMLSSLRAVIADKIEGRRCCFVVRKHVERRCLHNYLWRGMQVGTENTLLQCAIGHLLDLLQLLLCWMKADSVNRYVCSIGRVRKL